MPGIAVARELVRRHPEIRLLFVGAERGIEKRVVPAEGFELVTLRIGGFKRMGWRHQLANALGMALALGRALFVLMRFRPDVVVGLGGYASVPVMAAATVCRVPRLVMEQNVLPGLANRLAGRFATRIAVPDPSALPHFGSRAVVTGNPVRPEFKSIVAKDVGARLQVLVTGGSQGAEAINRAVIRALPYLNDLSSQLRFVHQTGSRQEEEVRAAYIREGFEADVRSFFPQMGRQYAEADLIVCRAGATTVAEVRAAGKAAVFIPFEFAADDHQRRNAQAMVEQGAARMIEPSDLSGGRLAEEVRSLVRDRSQLSELGRRARAMAVLDAESRIADLIEEMVEA